MNSRHVLALILMAGLAVGIGANPRFIEELKIGGGFGDPVDGGADLDKSGNVALSGTLVVGDANVTALDHGGASFTPRLHINTQGGSSSADQAAIGRNVDVAGDDPELWVYRSRGVNGTETVVQSGDSLGSIMFMGHDGTDYKIAGYIQANVDATPGTNDMPGNFVFYVTPDGAATPQAAVTIANDKSVSFTGDLELGANLLGDGLLRDADVFFSNAVDPSRKLRFETGNIATGITRTLTMANQDLNLAPNTGDFQASDADLIDIAAVSGDKGDLLVHDGNEWIEIAAGTDGQQLEVDSAQATGLKWANAGGDGSHPVSDATSIVEGSADATKELRLELDTHIATGTTRVWTVGNRNIDFASDVGFLDTAQEWTSAQTFDATTLTDAVNIVWDVSTNQVASVTLAGNRTLDNPTNLRDGGTYILIVRQDATGSRTLAFGSAYKWPAGSTPVLSTGANDVDVLTFVSDGTNMYGVAVRDFS